MSAQRHHIFVHFDLGGGADPRLDQLLAQGAKILMATTELKSQMKRIDDATNGISARIDALLAKLGTGMTQEEVDEIKAGLSAEADKLEGIAKDPDNPVPPTV